MIRRTLAAGDQIESMCTRCKALLNHTIVAMVEGRVVRVKCNTCGSEHNHRPQKTESPVSRRTAAVKTPAAARPKARRDPELADREEWETLSKTMDKDKAAAYDMNGSFRVNSLVNHQLFGIGLVCAVSENKMEVLFEGGRKVLRCN
ncbi:MAG: hypothetical protein M0T70_02410 [Geobacteraceae bacterium]|nr:hypothetical protein [Geobacteraceae bacterium]